MKQVKGNSVQFVEHHYSINIINIHILVVLNVHMITMEELIQVYL